MLGLVFLFFVHGECCVDYSWSQFLLSAVLWMDREHCLFEGFRIRLFLLVQLNMSCRYECTSCLAAFMFVWVERIVMSSAYGISFILLFGGVGMSDMYILNSVRESAPPCVACFDFLLLYSVNCWQPRMQFDRNFMTVLGMFVCVICARVCIKVQCRMLLTCPVRLLLFFHVFFFLLKPVVIVVYFFAELL